MCGIVGYIGNGKATSFLINGLSKLEYRGYDSAGVAVFNKDHLEVRKFKGRLTNLADNIKENPIEGTIGIGHTRWATHGAPSDVNSHPHLNSKETIAVVQNGIIEDVQRCYIRSLGNIFPKISTDPEAKSQIESMLQQYWENLSSNFTNLRSDSEIYEILNRKDDDEKEKNNDFERNYRQRSSNPNIFAESF